MSASLYGTRSTTPDPGDQTQTAGLGVSTRLVRLDPGLFGLSWMPGPFDPGTGLPAVRVSLPPGPPGRREAVSISTFRGDGWMTTNDEPILFRVLPGGAEVLVTLYWSTADAAASPPPLRLVRLNPEGAAGGPFDTSAAAAPGSTAGAYRGTAGGVGGGAFGGAADGAFGSAPGGTLGSSASGAFGSAAGGGFGGPAGGAFGGAAAGAPGGAAGGGQSFGPAAVSPPELSATRGSEVVAHIEGVGDIDGRLGEWVGARGSGRAIEGFSLAPRQGISSEDFEVRAVLGRDRLSPWLPGGSFCGSRGLALPLRGFCVRLRAAAAARFELACFAQFVDGSEVGPVGSDQVCAAPSLAALEAFQVLLRPRMP